MCINEKEETLVSCHQQHFSRGLLVVFVSLYRLQRNGTCLLIFSALDRMGVCSARLLSITHTRGFSVQSFLTQRPLPVPVQGDAEVKVES